MCVVSGQMRSYGFASAARESALVQCMVLFCIGSAWNASAAEHERASSSDMVWRAENCCGVNALYVLLRVKGLAPDYRALRSSLLASQTATSLGDLRRCADGYGLPCASARSTPEGLRSLPKPLIAHMEVLDGRAASVGHFVVVLRCTADEVLCMDGTTGDIQSMSWRDFQRAWTGYVLCSRGQSRPGFALLAFAMAGTLAALTVDLMLRRRFSCPSPGN